MLKYLNVSRDKSLKNLQTLLNRRSQAQKNQSGYVKQILSNVKKNGDFALLKYEKKFSKVKTKTIKIKFSKKEIDKIIKQLDKKL